MSTYLPISSNLISSNYLLHIGTLEATMVKKRVSKLLIDDTETQQLKATQQKPKKCNNKQNKIKFKI